MSESTEHRNVLDFKDPGRLSEELLNVPGFVNELKNYTLAVSPRPNPPLAFAGALAMLTHLSGRSYISETGLRTNLYLAALAPSGMGKDEARATNQKLAYAADILDSVPDSIASGEGLEDAIAQTPSLLLQTDEADALLTAMRNGDSRATRLNEMILRLFSESKAVHFTRLKAGNGKAVVIPYPHLTLFATGIPKFVYGALTAKALENGLFGRCLFIETNEFQPLGNPTQVELPPYCVETARMMSLREKSFTTTNVLSPVVVRQSEAANEQLAELRYKADTISRKLFDENLTTASAMYCRLYEKAIKLAMLWAISENPEFPEMSVDGILWATHFALHVTNKMLYEAQFYISEGKFDQLKKRFLALISKAGGEIDRSTALRLMHIDAITFQKIVLTLHMCDQIEEEMLSRRKIIYTLKSAA